MLEVPESAGEPMWLRTSTRGIDPYEDQFEKQSEAKKERIAKNEYQRLRNIARAEKSGTLKGTCQYYNYV